VATFNQFTTNAENNVEFLGAARSRFGFALVQPVLLYVSRGLASRQVEHSRSMTNPVCFSFCGIASTTSCQTG
jgi:hypothetical protein